MTTWTTKTRNLQFGRDRNGRRTGVFRKNAGSGGGAGDDFILNYDVPPDTVAPVLLSPTGAKATSSTYTGTVSTDEGNGALKWVVQPDTAATPTTLEIDLGLDGDGNPAVGGLNAQPVSATGVQNVSGGGLTNGVGYKIAYYQDDVAGNKSTVSLSASFGATATTVTRAGSLQGNHTGTGTKTVDLTPMSIPDDALIIVDYFSASNAYITLGVDGGASPGWTKIANVGPAASTYRSSMSRSYKQFVGAADTSVTLTGLGGSTRAGIIMIRAYTNVDPTTPFDVADVTTQSSSSPLVDPGSITPVTAGALILVGGVGATETANTTEFATPGDLGNWLHDIRTSGTTADNVAGQGDVDWTTGAFNAAAWTGPNNPGSCNFSCIVSAIRPAP